MDYRLDQKGKYYTTHVSKRTAHVQILAQGKLISGVMYLLLDNRVKDELNNGERFMAMTDAEVREPGSNTLLSQGETLILNKDQIVWVIPCESRDEPESSDESDTSTHDASGQ